MLSTTLGELVEAGNGFIQTGPFGSQLHARDYVDEGVPLVMPQQLGDNEVTRIGIAKMREQDRDRLRRHVMQIGDDVFSRRGDVTRRAYIGPEEDGWLCGTGCLLVRLEHPRCDTRYLARYFGTHEIKNYLIQHAVGATMPNLNQGILASVPVRLPTIDEQLRVVEILSTYDGLIENNRRRIELLEQSARLLYKEWFVHLRFPGHGHTQIKDGVPEGWKRKPLSEVATFRLGKMLDQKKNRGEPKPYLANLNVRWGEFDFSNLREMKFEDRENEIFGLKHGDIVMCEGGEPGRCAIWKEQIPGMMIQKAIHRIRPIDPLDYRYLYYSLFHQAKSGRLSQLFTGATIKHLPREKLAKVQIDIPPRPTTTRCGRSHKRTCQPRSWRPTVTSTHCCSTACRSATPTTRASERKSDCESLISTTTRKMIFFAFANYGYVEICTESERT